MNPMLLFQPPNTMPSAQPQKQAMSSLNILLGGLGRSPAAAPLAPSLGMPGKPPEPNSKKNKPILGGTING